MTMTTERAVEELLESFEINDHISPGMVDTPSRVAAAWKESLSGYQTDPRELFTVFEEKGCDEMVVLRDIEFASTCEHHLLPFLGRGHIGYIPKNGQVIGISKLARLLDCFSKRLAIQERIGLYVVRCLMQHLVPEGCGCVLEAKHLCIQCRGVGKQESVMVTSSMRGSFREDPTVRNEFLRMIGK